MLNNITADWKLNTALTCTATISSMKLKSWCWLCFAPLCLFVLSPYFYVTTFSTGSSHSHLCLELQASSQTSQSVPSGQSVVARTLIITVIIGANSASSNSLSNPVARQAGSASPFSFLSSPWSAIVPSAWAIRVSPIFSCRQAHHRHHHRRHNLHRYQSRFGCSPFPETVSTSFQRSVRVRK